MSTHKVCIWRKRWKTFILESSLCGPPQVNCLPIQKPRYDEPSKNDRQEKYSRMCFIYIFKKTCIVGSHQNMLSRVKWSKWKIIKQGGLIIHRNHLLDRQYIWNVNPYFLRKKIEMCPQYTDASTVGYLTLKLQNSTWYKCLNLSLLIDWLC